MTIPDNLIDDLAPTIPFDALCWRVSLRRALDDPRMVRVYRGASGNIWRPTIDGVQEDGGAAQDHRHEHRAFIRGFAGWFDRVMWAKRAGVEVEGRWEY